MISNQHFSIILSVSENNEKFKAKKIRFTFIVAHFSFRTTMHGEGAKEEA